MLSFEERLAIFKQKLNKMTDDERLDKMRSYGTQGLKVYTLVEKNFIDYPKRCVFMEDVDTKNDPIINTLDSVSVCEHKKDEEFYWDDSIEQYANAA